MCRPEHFLWIVVFYLYLLPMLYCLQSCEMAANRLLQEGNLGETGTFPWLGVLRVHLHEGDSLKIAVTGIVLVKDKYAIANADDVSRIPKHVFRDDSQAMFVPTAGKPWYSRLKDYITHFEYDYATFHTIALVELAADEIPFKPICWPGYSFNTSTDLYAVGYTDERQLLEKVIYKLQYISQEMCTEFYQRSGLLSSTKYIPTHFQCGFAVNYRENCAWDNGMVMVSNTTGTWMLIAFGIQGPGCAVPSRFIDIFTYLPWIQSTTSIESVYDDFRKKAVHTLQ
ncbi:plasma kallikrein-like [Galleria mellonella]|uniref:Plasma kallikrein-like n=1 Tax=Galleria mellonella TaxID=7137 RepID=A0ABM3MVR9_GALME|nr:plasma kallikrein-like [Galleria mellonella]